MASVQVSKYLSVLTDANPMTPRAKSNGKWNEGQTKLTKRIPTTQKKRENRLNRLPRCPTRTLPDQSHTFNLL